MNGSWLKQPPQATTHFVRWWISRTRGQYMVRGKTRELDVVGYTRRVVSILLLRMTEVKCLLLH